MSGSDELAAQFELHRTRLVAIASRILGSESAAEDVVQDAWLRLDRAGASGIENLGGWLTTVVSRLCLDMLRSATTSREVPTEVDLSSMPAEQDGPERSAIVSESSAEALILIMETLTPPERVAFVLHDLFDIPFDEISAILDRPPAATRQLASRARRRVRGANPEAIKQRDPRREVIEAFFAASRDGHLDSLIRLLSRDVVLRADPATMQMGAEAEVRGGNVVAEFFSGKSKAARPAKINGVSAAVWAPGGKPRVVFQFTIEDDLITAIDLISDQETIASLDLEIGRDW